MKQEQGLCNRLRQLRLRFGMSQQDLATVAGVSRQTISGVESGQYAPSATIALRLAKALGCRMEDLFWLENDSVTIEATATQPLPNGRYPVSVARVGHQYVAYPLVGNSATRTELIPMDGEGELLPTPNLSSNKLRVNLWETPERLHQTVVLAGCTPALSLWARATERWHPEFRVHWNFANSTAALNSLHRGELHVAGVHLYHPETAEHNTPFVQETLVGKAAVLITLGLCEEGLLMRRGNPKQLKTLTDLAQTGVMIVNRECGAGCRQLLERLLLETGVPFEAVQGFDQLAYSHWEVAQAIASGKADAGVSNAAIAAAFDLDFMPLHQSRYDLVVLKEYLELAPVERLFSTLNNRWVHSQLKVLAGYDTGHTGEVVATIKAANP